MPMETVLVVDDDPSIVDLVTVALEDEGYRVVSAAGAGALPLARTAQPAVILLDLMMPGMDGGEVSAHLRADPTTAAIPIVVMSAQDRLGAMSACLAIDDRLPKPFDLAHLYATVARWARTA